MPLLRFPVYGQVLYLAFNGYIVGREMFNNAAGRRIDAEQTKRLRRPNYFRVWIAGMFMTLLWVVPGLNLIGPVIAPAFTLQLVERLRGTDRRTSAGR